MTNQDILRGAEGFVERLINYAGSRFAKMQAAVLYNSSETEIGTVAEPLCVVGRDQILPIAQTPTITAGAYAVGDAVGGLLTFAAAALSAGRGGVIVKVLIVDDAGQNVPYDLHLFDRTFTVMTDNAAWNPSDADMQHWEGFVDVAATDRAAGAGSSGSAKSTGLRCPFPYVCDGTSLFGQLVVPTVAPTYTATDDITVIIYVERW